MFKITKGGATVAMTEAPNYIKQAENGCFVLCPEAEATGIAHNGTVYHLLGRPDMAEAEITVMLEETDAGVEIAKVDRLETEVQAMRKADGEQEAINCRYRILRFGDEVKHGTRHSQEHFEQILADIDAYEIYCKDHKDFKNNKTKVTTERILDVYRKCVETDDFF